MRTYNYIEAEQNLAAVLNTALTQDVIVKIRDGEKFKITPIKEDMNRSPFEITGINTGITTEEIVKTIKQSRRRLRRTQGDIFK